MTNAAVTYTDDGITEYADGSAEAHFSDVEWAAMMADPARFGYTCKAGHAWSDAGREHGYCCRCEAEIQDNSDVSDEEIAAAEAWLAAKNASDALAAAAIRPEDEICF